MKDQINNRLEQIWADVTEEMIEATTPGDLKKLFVAYGFLENIIINIAEDIDDPELQVRLLNYCEFAMKAVGDFGKTETPPNRTAEILQFPKRD